jgi:hypothetical protein
MKIVVNGREYASPDELPAEARADYERAMSALADKNGNGIPDILEMDLGALSRSVSESGKGPATTVITSQKFVINGREYESVEQMPPDDRRQFDRVQSLLAGGSQPEDSMLPPIRRSLEPLHPAEWAPSRGLLTTDTLTILFVGMLIGALVICGIFVVMGGLQWLLPG